MPYSLDLRKRALAAIRAGMTRTQASEIYQVCRKTLYNWLSLEKKTGNLKPTVSFQKGRRNGKPFFSRVFNGWPHLIKNWLFSKK